MTWGKPTEKSYIVELTMDELEDILDALNLSEEIGDGFSYGDRLELIEKIENIIDANSDYEN